MSETAQVKAINCTSCGSPLPALAGHRAKTLICSYCGAVMDQHDHYKVLARYRDMERPHGPFEIGMRGAVMGVEHTVVGIVGVKARIEGALYGWTNYQIYSPTHGYSWLTWSDCHLTHTRKTRDMPDQAGSFAYRGALDVGDRRFTMYEQYTARIDYLEGELTWTPALGDETQVIEAIDPPNAYAVAVGERETEFEYTTYLDRKETFASFGIEDTYALRPRTVHGAQPFIPGPFYRAISRVSLWFAGIALVLGIVIAVIGRGEQIAGMTVADPVAGGALSFPLTRIDRLARIDLTSNVQNAWSWYDIELINEDTQETVAEFGAGIEYYTGRDSEGTWTEGSQTATLRFKPPAIGAYRLSLVSGDPQSARLPVRIAVYENVMLSRYLFVLAPLFLLLWFFTTLYRGSFEKKRWQ